MRTHLLLLSFFATACSPGDNFSETGSSTSAYTSAEAKWQSNNIEVCWENPEGYSTETMWVKEAVEGTWEAVSAIDFTGWNKCSSNSRGIRIGIADAGPHTKGLGRGLDGVKNGMVLNFTFETWAPTCKDGSRQSCIHSIAVHEFGHGLGFSHEQNRPDTPASCKDAPQGSNGNVVVGDWDADSVMNYCNRYWNNNGRLSFMDKKATILTYGGTVKAVLSRNLTWREAEFNCPYVSYSEIASIRTLSEANDFCLDRVKGDIFAGNVGTADAILQGGISWRNAQFNCPYMSEDEKNRVRLNPTYGSPDFCR
jgi:hypothetical protein